MTADLPKYAPVRDQCLGPARASLTSPGRGGFLRSLQSQSVSKSLIILIRDAQNQSKSAM